MIQKKLLILTSPPASGKTYWIKSFQDTWEERLLVISPLRALANECSDKNGSTTDFMTPEEWMDKKTNRKVVIIDEFHLFFYWGDTFRPVMWEAFFEISQSAELMILLTATLSSEMKEEMAKFAHHFDEMMWIDHGNQ
jgi:superfamily II DNA helicase RecQ